MAIPLTVHCCWPTFVSVTDFVIAVPTVALPKLSDGGWIWRLHGPSVPSPEMGSTAGGRVIPATGWPVESSGTQVASTSPVSFPEGVAV